MSRGSKKYPDHYADPFGLDDPPVTGSVPPPEILPIRTGFDEGEDANRFIAEEFAPGKLWCSQCEVWFMNEIRCRHCNWTLDTEKQYRNRR